MKSSVKSFRLKEEYLTSVRDTGETSIHFPNGEMVKGTYYTTIDHPKFTILRNRLGAEGYIKIVDHFWNMDRVLKPFKLNGVLFSVGDKFCCGAALGIQFQVKKSALVKSLGKT